MGSHSNVNNPNIFIPSFNIARYFHEKYLVMLNAGEEYLKIVSVGVSRPSKYMHFFKTDIQV